jgi:ABC-2 type transport system ATP-binding protein
MNFIEAENITRRFKSFQALAGLSFSVSRGEIFGFLGPNGAGKTTTIRILTTQIRPDSGRASIMGFDTVKEPDKVKNVIGVVFEEQNFYPRLTVGQNLLFFARLYGLGQKEVDRVLGHVQLTDRKGQEAEKLSRGLKQRLMIARALLPDPQVIFLDEPTVGLDPHVAREIRSIFKDLKGQGKTIFLTTHYMEEADELCDRVAIIDSGSIVGLDTPENLKAAIGRQEITIKIADPPPGSTDSFTFAGDDPAAAARIQDLLEKKVKFHIIPARVSLEDVFMKLTGNTLQ